MLAITCTPCLRAVDLSIGSCGSRKILSLALRRESIQIFFAALSACVDPALQDCCQRAVRSHAGTPALRPVKSSLFTTCSHCIVHSNGCLFHLRAAPERRSTQRRSSQWRAAFARRFSPCPHVASAAWPMCKDALADLRAARVGQHFPAYRYIITTCMLGP